MDIFFIVFSLIILSVIFMNVTPWGRELHRKLTVGDVIEDYGVIGEEGAQKIGLLKCKNNEEVFFVLEIHYSGLGNRGVEWIKLGEQTAQKLRYWLK